MTVMGDWPVVGALSQRTHKKESEGKNKISKAGQKKSPKPDIEDAEEDYFLNWNELREKKEEKNKKERNKEREKY